MLVVDGMPLDGQMTIAALGVETSGKKHLLGFREGATENAEVCIDGSRGLRKAVDDFYGTNAIVHRCHFHKSKQSTA